MVSIKGLNRSSKRAIAFLSDIFMTAVALFTADWLSSTTDLSFYPHFIFIIGLQSILFLVCGLYLGIWRFASIPDLFRILKAILYGFVISYVYLRFVGMNSPIKLSITYSVLAILLLSGSRVLYRRWNDYHSRIKKGKRVLIVGAGNAGEWLVRDLLRANFNNTFIPVGFVDDDLSRMGCEIHGVKILGCCKDIYKIVKKHNIELILIAIPSVDASRMREIVNYCEKSKIPFRTLPGLKDITNGSVSINSLREVLLEDLLGREQVSLDWEAIQSSITNKTILVTGGGGSIGSELCRQMNALIPKQLIIVDNNEYNLYAIDLELRKNIKDVQIYTYLCSVVDKIEMAKIFKRHRPDIVFHVAAYKHVPLLENNIRVAMYNNIVGTRVTAELSVQSEVKNFVLISTDKAVNPTNIMGATKRASEIFCQNYNLCSTTKFTTVRFGNVLDSTGSVIPLFRKQLLQGGPLTVTHPEITRYFMTIPEASQLILQALTMNQKGEIFVLDMGAPIKICYLAEQMIKLSGKTVGKDIGIKYIGLRPGEKLHEELFHHQEKTHSTSHPKIYQADVRIFEWSKLISLFDQIENECLKNDETKLRQLLCQLVPEYHHSNNNPKEINSSKEVSIA